MAAKSIRSHAIPISIAFTLATADDLDGTADGTQYVDATGAYRAIITQIDNGSSGAVGVDVIEYSHEAIPTTWAAATDLVPMANDDYTGNIAASGALNAAGVEPATKAVAWRCGPFPGPTWIRVGRKTTDTAGTTWTGGAPTVLIQLIGGKHSGGAVSTYA